MKPIYLDYAATTPIDPIVVKKMLNYLEKNFGNPSSMHSYGLIAKDAIETARNEVAALLSADPAEIIWTSGATESINLAIKGAAKLYRSRGNHIITLKTEHKAVLDSCQHLEKNGYQVSYLKPGRDGLIDLDQLKAAISDSTILISIMHVNNETGVIQDINAIAHLAKEHDVLCHVDAAQSAGKLPLNLQEIPIDLLSLTAHKMYGPKGIGALYLRKKPRVRVEPLIHGGGHEQGMRSGTLPTHQIVGMGEASRLAKEKMQHDFAHATNLKHLFIESLKPINNFELNVQNKISIPNILNIRFEGMLAEVLLTQTPMIATSSASACQGKGIEGSYVLRAMGFTEDEAKSSIRFSFGRFTEEEEIKTAAEYLRQLFNN